MTWRHRIATWLLFKSRKLRGTSDGHLTISTYDANTHELIETIRTENMVVKTGRNKYMRMLFYPSLDAGPIYPRTPGRIAVGTGTTAPADTDTDLEAQVTYKPLRRIIPGDSKINLQTKLETTDANGNTLTEAGIQLSGSTGLFARATYTGIVKTVSIYVVYDWTITLAAG